MNRKTTVALFYLGVAIVSAIILGFAFLIRSRISDESTSANRGEPQISNVGKEKAAQWFPIAEDLDAINQNGEKVKLSDLRGKVFLVAQFFAVCPHCAVRNGEELHQIRETFGGNPDFHIACISVDPESDNQERLKSYAEALKADAKQWWFLNAGSEEHTHQYLENVLKFFSVRERTDPLDIEANGRFAHDLGFLLVNRDFEVIGKWPLADARSEQARALDPELYDRLKKELYSAIERELAKQPSEP